jgi:hypothetical protein
VFVAPAARLEGMTVLAAWRARDLKRRLCALGHFRDAAEVRTRGSARERRRRRGGGEVAAAAAAPRARVSSEQR